VLAEVLGYGKSCDAVFPGHAPSEDSSALPAAIRQALGEAGVGAEEIDLICGSSWADTHVSDKELGAIREVFSACLDVPVVNYNGHFGFVESAAALLNLVVLLEAMKQGEIPPIPHTRDFRDDSIAFVREPLRKELRTVLVIGASDGGNNYAVVLRKGPLDV